MKKKRRSLTAPFVLMCLLVAVPLLMRAWHLRYLYTSSYVRESTQAQILNLTELTGWVRSDLSLQRVTKDTLEVIYRPHFKGHREDRCVLIPLEGPLSFPLLPCDEQ
jgi:hypothetical protein